MEGLSGNIDDFKKKLFKTAMKGEWDKVIEIYEKNQEIHKAKITRSGGTALHIAASDGQVDVVEELVRIIQGKQELINVLKIGDERGNTALHIAATLGSVSMCRSIASADSKLIGARNHDSETPFFLAALHGHKGAFLCLHSICDSDADGYSYSRRKDGDTILHCAISGDYFDLAFQIIHHYKDLVNSVNEQGQSPLHVLAAKPNAFRSGSHLGRFERIIYHCIFIDELQREKSYNQNDQFKTDEKKVNYPQNYEICISFTKLLKTTVKVLTDKTGTKKEEPPERDAKKPQAQVTSSRQQRDAENPQVTNNRRTIEKKPQQRDEENPQEESSRSNGAQGHLLFPPNYGTCFEFVKLVSKAMLVILGFGSTKIRKIREKKQKQKWSVQILDELLKSASLYEYEDDGRKPLRGPSLIVEEDETSPYKIVDGGTVAFMTDDDQQQVTSPIDGKLSQNNVQYSEDRNGGGIKDSTIPEMAKRETPILIAAKNGITEVVDKILEKFPVAIHDMNSEKKNIVLLAVENRQPHVYQLLLKITMMKDSVFRKVDCNGNSALHLAATLGQHKPWLIPGAALQMQWEIKWFQFVKDSMPFHFFVHYNKNNKSPKDVFSETHNDLVKAGGEWLTNTSESCSVVAALIATVAFATSSTVPGGVKEGSGEPTLEDQPAFNVFAISSLIALCFSVTAVVLFLSILTSRYQERDFGKDLPRKLLLGLTSLFVSIASILVSFCAGHFFVLRDKLKFAAFPIYAVTCLPVTFFAVAQFPLYFDLLWATFRKVPQRSYRSS